MASPLLQSEKNYQKEYLDSGAFGAVFKITLNKDKKVFALKQIDLGKLEQHEIPAALAEAKKENDVMRKNIPNVLRSFGSFYDSVNKLYLISTELMDSNLRKFIYKNGPLSFENFVPIFRDILTGKYPFLMLTIYFRF